MFSTSPKAGLVKLRSSSSRSSTSRTLSSGSYALAPGDPSGEPDVAESLDRERVRGMRKLAHEEEFAMLSQVEEEFELSVLPTTAPSSSSISRFLDTSRKSRTPNAHSSATTPAATAPAAGSSRARTAASGSFLGKNKASSGAGNAADINESEADDDDDRRGSGKRRSSRSGGGGAGGGGSRKGSDASGTTGTSGTSYGSGLLLRPRDRRLAKSRRRTLSDPTGLGRFSQTMSAFNMDPGEFILLRV